MHREPVHLETYPRLLALQSRGVRYGLDRIEAMLAYLGHPERNANQTLLIAGTNGKGSVAAMTSAGVVASGRSVGLFTSPHLTLVTERFRIGDVDVSGSDFDRTAETLLAAIESSDIPISFFEAMTAMGALLFAEAGVDVQIFEAGLGGRRDATAALTPTHVAVTSIARDHASVLGHTLSAIATEKLGLCRPGTLNVFNLPARLRELAPEGWHVGRDVRRRALGDGGIRVRYPNGQLDLPPPALRGAHQRANATVAAAAMLRLGLDDAAIAAGVTRVHWPARLQRIDGDPVVWIDGAHNPVAVTRLLESFDEAGITDGYTLVFGAGPGKEAANMLARLSARAGQVVLTTVERLRTVEDLAALSTCPEGAHPVADPAAALKLARSFGQPVLVAGSLYLAGAVLPELR
ncbi:MAG: dihydrofolate synthase/folylpolyglutamate synthase [Myxococcota bacterium]|jgi:dihydrofolate synthase/folylpolyglutamate synthase